MTMDTNFVVDKMKELQDILGYDFTDIEWLKEAMRAVKVRGKDEHSNDRIAIVSDTLLKFFLADYLYHDKQVETKEEITKQKSDLENNGALDWVTKKEHIIDYAFNDLHFHSEDNIPDHESVADGKHNGYIEGIIGAIYYDGGYEKAREWIQSWLLPRLLEYREINNSPKK